MPELPEVEVVRLGLEPALVGATLAHVQVFDPRSLKRHDARRGDFAGMLTGRVVTGAQRRGKFLWFPLEDRAGDSGQTDPAGNSGQTDPASLGEALVVHLGMSGQVLLNTLDASPERHLRIQFELDHEARETLLMSFVDQRIFGSMAVDDLVRVGSRIVPSQVAHIAADPLEPDFDDERFVRALRAKRTGVKRAILDQTLISGVGNIYADEALWASRVHGERAADTLTRAQANTLLAEIRAVLHKALAEGGTSFDTQYLNVNGEAGYFAHSLNAYGQTGKACPRCGTPIVRVAFMNRSSHFCPRCQRR